MKWFKILTVFAAACTVSNHQMHAEGNGGSRESVNAQRTKSFFCASVCPQDMNANANAINFASKTHNSSKSHNCDRRWSSEAERCRSLLLSAAFFRGNIQMRTDENCNMREMWACDVHWKCQKWKKEKKKFEIGNNSKHIFVGIGRVFRGKYAGSDNQTVNYTIG